MEVYVRFDIMRTEGMNRSGDLVEEALMEECRNIGQLDVEDSMYEVEPELVEAPTESAARKELLDLKRKAVDDALKTKLDERDRLAYQGLCFTLSFASDDIRNGLDGANPMDKLQNLVDRYVKGELVDAH